jgi:hypothetical protein
MPPLYPFFLRYPMFHSPRLRLVVVLAMAFLCGPVTPAQEREGPPLRLGGVVPGGLRTSATESWGMYDFSVTNLSDQDRLARVLAFFPDRPDVQYGRDVWIPANSTQSSWMLIGPASKSKLGQSSELQMLLYDRSEGNDRLILPKVEERIRSRGVPYRHREPTTALFLDEEVVPQEILGQLPQPESREEEVLHLAMGFRLTRILSEYVPRVHSQLLPPVEEAFDGIDHFILASNRITRDPAGLQALRHWLERGGKVWVMLDQIEPDVLAPLLGDALDFQVVDRIGLTSFQFQQHTLGERTPAMLKLQKYERPVDFVRVLLPAHEQAKYTINGWPLWFTRTVGRGKVVVSTLGSRGWFRERAKGDPPSPYQHFSSFPVPLSPLEDLGWELHHRDNVVPFPVEAFRPLLIEEIGYSVLDRGAVVLVFGVFLLAVLALGIGLRQSRRPELLGWLAPAAALAATSIFVVLGEISRRAAPPTVGVAQVVDAVSGKEEASLHGLIAVYRPDSGTADLGVTRGGFFDLNVEGLEGQTRRLVLTDVDAWHWENLVLPAGVRLSPFHCSVPTAKPITAVAHFGPAGIEGRLQAGPFEELSDVLLSALGSRNLAVQLHPDGTFRSGSQDILPKGQFLAAAVLNDRQQHQQNLYREFLNSPRAEYLQERNVLLAWAKPIDPHFRMASEARFMGSALLVIPLRIERPAPGQRVTIPGPLLAYHRILKGLPTRPLLDSNQNVDMHLRFQVPVEVLPFRLESARLFAKIDAPSRRVTISAQAGGEFVEIHRIDSPLDPIRLDINERFLHLDDAGGLHVNVNVKDAGQGEGSRLQEKWIIDYLELEVSGHTER